MSVQSAIVGLGWAAGPAMMQQEELEGSAALISQWQLCTLLVGEASRRTASPSYTVDQRVKVSCMKEAVLYNIATMLR